VFDSEFFREDRPRLTHQARTQLVLPVLSLTRNLAVQLGNLAIHNSPTPREFGFGITRAVQVFELGLVVTQPARILDLLKGAIVTRYREKMLNAPVKANGTIPTLAHGLAVDRDRDVPPAVAMKNLTRLGRACVSHTASHANMAHTREAKLAVLALFARHQSPSVAMRFVPPAGETVEGFEPGISRFLACFDPAEKRLEGQVDSVQRDLTRLGIESANLRIVLAQPSQFGALLASANRHPLASPSQAPLLQECIVQAHVYAFHIQHLGFLPWREMQAIRDFALHVTGGRFESFESFNLCCHGAYINLVIMKTQELTKLYHCVYCLDYHLVIVTKYRRRGLTAEMRVRAREIFEATLTKWGRELLEANGKSDHMHLLISTPPTISLSKLVNNLKTVSSRLLRKEFAKHLARVYRKPVLWHRAYFVVTCGGAPLSVMKQYIENQKDSDC
jgi:putative transposase